MELRPGYKMTEIGVIPGDWDVVRLRDCFTISAGGDIDRSRSSAMQDSRFRFPVYANAITNRGLYGFADYAESPANSVTITARGYLGHAEFRDHPFTAIVRLLVLVPTGAALPSYVSSYINERVTFAIESTGVPQLTAPQVGRYSVALPPLPEQKAITEALSDVDASIAALSLLIAKKRDLRQGAMQRLLTGQTRLPGFAAPWQEKRLGELGRFLKGSGVRRDESQSGDLPCVRYGEIYTTHQNVVRNFASYISRAVARTATRIQRGDILFAASGETKEEIGKCVGLALDVEAYAGGDIIILRLNSGAPAFFGYLLNTPNVVRQKANKGQGDAVVHIGASALAAIQISLPDDDEQNAIAGVLSDIDAEISTLETCLDKTRALKQAMMQALLTGRVRLPVQRDAAPQTQEVEHA